MTLTYADLVNKVARLVSDPDVSTYSEDIYHDSICAAHDAVLMWLPNYKSVVYEATSGSDGLFKLPDDVYDLQAVKIGTDGAYIYKATLAATTTRPNSLTDCDWIENPKGYLSLSFSDVEDPVTVHYLAYWAKPPLPTSNDFVIVVPSCGIMGLVYYAASVVLTPVIVDTSTLGPFKQRIDSGTPQMNPMRDTAEWFKRMFLNEMKMMPPYQKAQA